MKHTKGPWFVRSSHADNLCVYGQRHESIICRVNEDYPNHYEDAQLMAAAPEMLAALETVLATFPEIRTDEPMSGADTIEALSLIWNSLEEAVKKAKGGAE